MNLRILPFLAAIGLLASCTSGTEGIFASLEREQKIVSLGGLSQSATVTSMAESGGKYYATGGKALFSRSTTGTSWDKSTVGGATEVQAVGAIGTNVFAVAGGKLWTSSDGVTWSDITPAGVTAYSLVPIVNNDGYTVNELTLLTTGDSGDKKTIYHVTGNVTPTEDVNLASVLTPTQTSLYAEVTSAVKAGPSDYYLASESFVWHIGNATWDDVATTQVTTAPANRPYQGLLAVNGTGLYLSTRDGYLYFTTSLTGASPVFGGPLKADLEVDSGHETWLHAMIFNTTNNSVWIATGAADSATGKEGNGYVEWSGSELKTTPDTNTSNYNSSVLPKAAVGTFFRSSTGDYFLGTVAHGLWKWNSASKTWSQQ